MRLFLSMDTFMIFCAKYLYILPFLLAAAFFLQQSREIQFRILMFGLVCAVSSYLIALALGQMYFDPRPFVEYHFKPLIPHDTENGFPSDHVLLVGAVAAVLFIFNKTKGLIAWACTILIAIARVYVGVHHIVDVLTSMLIVISVSTILYFTLYKRQMEKLNRLYDYLARVVVRN